MTKPTHIRQLNGFTRGPLVDSVRPYPEQIAFSLNQLDGVKSWAYSLWRAPEGADLLEEIPFSEEYMQAAGTSEAMTVEVRLLDAGGVARQYTLGKQSEGELSAGQPTETISWDDGRRSTKVYPHEVFTADEAAEIFYAFFLTDKVADGYLLRELNI